jgi:hypothetical protein
MVFNQHIIPSLLVVSQPLVSIDSAIVLSMFMLSIIFVIVHFLYVAFWSGNDSV